MSDGDSIKRLICTFCNCNCGVLAHVREGKIVRITGNPDNAISGGYVCRRIKYAIKWLYHPEQLKYPLKRLGARGENKWQRITWEQALGEIAEKLGALKEKYGPETLAVTEGTLRGAQFWERSRFCNLFGNPHNVFHPGTACALNRFALGHTIAGYEVSQKDPGAEFLLKHTNCFVLWGTDKTSSDPRGIGQALRERRKRPIRFIVVDPRVTKTAEVADFHLQLRPGTDCALALGWTNVIINEQLYDKDFVRDWTVGFDELAGRAQEYPPQLVSEITGVRTDDIVRSARMFADSKPAVIIAGCATDQIGLNGTRVEQVNAINQALTGNIDIIGGSMMNGIGPRNDKGRFIRDVELEALDSVSGEQRRKQIGFDRFKIMSWAGYEHTTGPHEKFYGLPEFTMHRVGASAPLLWRAILTGEPYPVKALINWESNPLQWAANTRNVYNAMKSPNLELFVVHDFWMTPSALLADYVLPAASWMESSYADTFEDFRDAVVGGEKAVEPLGERRDNYYFWRGLGTRLGQKDHWPWETMEEVIAYRLKPMGITFEEFIKTGALLTPIEEKKYEKSGFPTPTGKFELSSTILEKLGYDPLPFFEEPAESPVRTPDVAKEYPFILITGTRFMPQYHSEHRHFGTGMREVNPDPLADVNIKDAGRLGIHDGDWIYIETRRGRIRQRARVSDKILEGVVNVQAGWWFPEMPAEDPSLHGLWESNANVLTLDDPDTCDPLSGGWQVRALLCKIGKVQ